jgi:HAD superfamily hydrolase (TIGR01549 family)
MKTLAVPEVVLFDLDDTLLANDMDVFIPAYFGLLGKFAQGRFASELLIQSLRTATRAMMSSPGVRNDLAFWEQFGPLLGSHRDELEPFFEEFYAREFGTLRYCTQPVDGAVEVVEWFRARGSRLVLATNPVFPRSAIVHRLAWAGFEVPTFEFLTTYENMHTTKPDPGYYREILARVGVSPERALMVGNDLTNDIEPAITAGISTFYVVADGSFSHEEARGSLRQWHTELSRAH